jgi:hypothetical protein
MRPEQVEGLLTAVILGVIIGGRMGYALFYQPGGYLSDPLSILRIWEGGMSFHGGLIGCCRRRVDLLPPREFPAASGRRRHGDGRGHRHRARPGRELHQCRALGAAHRHALGRRLSR